MMVLDSAAVAVEKNEESSYADIAVKKENDNDMMTDHRNSSIAGTGGNSGNALDLLLSSTETGEEFEDDVETMDDGGKLKSESSSAVEIGDSHSILKQEKDMEEEGQISDEEVLILGTKTGNHEVNKTNKTDDSKNKDMVKEDSVDRSSEKSGDRPSRRHRRHRRSRSRSRSRSRDRKHRSSRRHRDRQRKSRSRSRSPRSSRDRGKDGTNKAEESPPSRSEQGPSSAEIAESKTKREPLSLEELLTKRKAEQEAQTKVLVGG